MKNKDRQKLFRESRKKDGWRLLWIPPHLILKVKQWIKDGEK